MTIARPFKAIRPSGEYAKRVSSLPYDVVSEEEARAMVKAEPLSFMKVIRPETAFDTGVDIYGADVYEKAREILNEELQKGVLIQDESPCYYIYRQMSQGRVQTGLVACFSVDAYLNGNIKEHEATRKDKEDDRTRHIDVCGANTGPVYLAYKNGRSLRSILDHVGGEPIYDFVSADNVRQIVWRICEPEAVSEISAALEGIDAFYIADGHHRSASAATVCKKRRIQNPDYTGDEEFNYFMAVAFPSEELVIMPYYRVVKDLNGLTREEFLERLADKFTVNIVPPEFTESERQKGVTHPSRKYEIAMYLDGKWYRLNAKPEIIKKDPVGVLDVSLLQENVLEPILGIEDPRTSDRIDFVGGIRGMDELERRCSQDMRLAFALYPTSMNELMNVADGGLFMPPKSTWFEPKLQSGLFIHQI